MLMSRYFSVESELVCILLMPGSSYIVGVLVYTFAVGALGLRSDFRLWTSYVDE